jgi:NADH-quinone oxidoreductase subunit C
MADEDVQIDPGEELDTEAEREPASESLHGAVVSYSCDEKVVHPPSGDYQRVVKALHDDGYVMCVDLTATDYLVHPARRTLPVEVEPERFEVVVNLLSHRDRSRVRVRVQVAEDHARLPSLWELYPSTEAAEREVFDMFGIEFEGHPDLTRILMPEDWVGHPLRKDYSSGRIPVQFKNPVSGPDEPGTREMGFPAGSVGSPVRPAGS